MSLLSPQLQAFVSIVVNKTVHAAAAEINLTQTAVTQRIRSLEYSLKTTLFIRTRKGMRLTPEGEALYRYCQASKMLEGEALAAIRGNVEEQEVELRISGPTSLMHARIIPACVPVMKKFPNLLLQFNVNDKENLNQALKSGETDIAVVREDQVAKEIQFANLQPEEYVLVAPTQWHGRKLNDIIKQERIVDYGAEDQITFDYLKQNNLIKFANPTRYFVNSTEDLAELVAAGIGYTTLTKEFALPYVAANKLILLNDEKIMQVKQLLAWYDRPTPPEYFSYLLNILTKI